MRISLPATVLVLTALLVLSACTVPAQMGESPLPETTSSTPVAGHETAAKSVTLSDHGLAPELHNDVWFNSEPLKLADLRGNVVIVEFWTYG